MVRWFKSTWQRTSNIILYAPTLQSDMILYYAPALQIHAPIYIYAPHNSFLTCKMPVCSSVEGSHPDEARRGERYIGTHPDEAQRGCAEFLRRNLVTTFSLR